MQGLGTNLYPLIALQCITLDYVVTLSMRLSLFYSGFGLDHGHGGRFG